MRTSLSGRILFPPFPLSPFDRAPRYGAYERALLFPLSRTAAPATPRCRDQCVTASNWRRGPLVPCRAPHRASVRCLGATRRSALVRPDRVLAKRGRLARRVDRPLDVDELERIQRTLSGL